MSLGSIVVRLSMRTAEFETDAGRAAKVAEKRAKEIDAAFKKAGNAIGVALGAAALGAAAAIKGAVDRMDELSKSAQRVGMPTEEFSRLAYAGSLADVEVSTLVSTLGKLTKAQSAALNDTSEQARVFEALGIAVKNADGSLRSSSDVMLEFADVFAAMEGSPEAMAAGFALFGRSFQDMVPLIKDGSGAMLEMFAESDRLGATLSTETGQAAEAFNDNLTRMQTALNGAWMEIASGMLPALEDLTGQLVDASGKTNDLREAGEWLGGQVKAAASDLMFMVDTVRDLNLWAGQTADGLRNMGSAMAQVLMGNFAGGKGFFQRAQQNADNAYKAFFSGRPDFSNVQGTPQRVVFAGIDAEPAGMFRMSEKEAQARREAEALRKRLQDALGNTGAGGRKSGGGGKARAAELTEEQKAAQRLNEEYARSLEGMRERLGLMGLETEAAKMKWKTEEGSFKALDPMRKAELIAQAALVDAKQKALELAEKEKRDAEQLRENYQRAIDDIQTERDMLGMSADQQEIYNRLKWAGVEANSAFGQSIIEETELLQQQRKAMGDQIALMDAFRDGATGALTDFVTGAKSAKEALGDFFDDMARMITRMIAERWMEQLFGKPGTTGAGTSGGDWLGAIFGALFGGKGFSVGGYTGPGGVMQPAGVVHKGEVVWSQGDVARAGGVAAVEAMRKGGARGSTTISQTFVVQGTPDRRTREQMARDQARAARRAMARA